MGTSVGVAVSENP